MAAKLGALVLLILFADVQCKVQNQALTQSMGQEVIEMASPDKELPADLDEEPSAESVESKVTSTTVGGATQNVQAKTNISRRVNAAKDEESRIEKELAELYKDPDYKDSGEVKKADGRKSAAKVAKPVHKPGLKFQPDDYSEVGLARFRTQTDKVDCTTDRKTQALDAVEPRQEVLKNKTNNRIMYVYKVNPKSSAARAAASIWLLSLAVCF